MSRMVWSIIHDSLQDLTEEFELYFQTHNLNMISYVFLKSGRVLSKLERMLTEPLNQEQISEFIKIREVKADLHRRLSRWHERLAHYYESHGELEKAEKEWLNVFDHKFDCAYDSYIQYAHVVLRMNGLLVHKPFEENKPFLTIGNVQSTITALRKAKRATKYAIVEQGQTEVTNYLESWIREMEEGIKKDDELVAALSKSIHTETLEEVMAELKEMIGLPEIKRKIREVGDWVIFNQLRQEKGYRADSLSLHMVFSGHPGTGKTTVARVVARVLKALGVLKKGHLVEVDRSELVAEYVGQTAVKTMKKIKEAIDGVLFIDEAYALTRSEGNDFGMECIDTLVKAMEDKRQNLVIIFAGYPVEMKRFMKSNPGLRSRIQHQFDFVDYTLDEMMSIASLLLSQKQFRMTYEAQALFKNIVDLEMRKRPLTHGNGRLVRNLIEEAVLSKATTAIEQKGRSMVGEVDLDTIDANIMNMVSTNKGQ